MLHLSTDMRSCHSQAQPAMISRPFWSLSQPSAFEISKYSLTSSANFFCNNSIVFWYFCQIVYKMRKETGPRLLPCTTPLNRSTNADNEQPTLVWCVRLVTPLWTDFEEILWVTGQGATDKLWRWSVWIFDAALRCGIVLLQHDS